MRHIAILMTSQQAGRQREALRAALGLGLRGARVTVVLAAEPQIDDAQIARALATLEELGRTIVRGSQLPEDADLVEIWT